MKSHFLLAVFLFLLFTSCAQKIVQNNTLNKLWETGSGLKTPESVLYDTATKLIFVSNVDGSPAKKDTAGFISTLSIDGKIIQTQWVKGLHAPKGMGILNKHLFVTNIDEVVEIDIATATIVKRYPVEGSKFLNDIAIDPKTGMIFVTDTSTGQVFVMLDGGVSLWLGDEMFKGANGLYLKDSSLYIGTNNSILKANIISGELVVAMVTAGQVDGLFVTSDDTFIYSDFSGSVYYARQYHRPEVLLNISAEKVNAADFGIIALKNMIMIPTFGDNKVVCYTSKLIQ